MFKSCTKKYTDESDEFAFRFTFYCDGCGKPIPPKPIEFTEANTSGVTPTKKRLWKMMWQKEHAVAFGRAMSEAQNKLFQCPCCFEYVCEDCTRSVQTPDGGINPRCKRCFGTSARNKPFGFVSGGKPNKEGKP